MIWSIQKGNLNHYQHCSLLTLFRAPVQAADTQVLEKSAGSIIKEKQKFVRLSMSKADLLEMFKYSKYKVHFINQRVPEGESSTVYRCGSLIDFCRGPHVQHTGKVKAFSILRVR
jgi:threonyl-tRNA synthetase